MSASLGLRGLLELGDILDCNVGHDFLLRGELGWAYRAGGLAHSAAVDGGTGKEGCPWVENTEACVSVDLRKVSGVMEYLVKAAGRPVVVRDENGGVLEVAPDIVAAADGLLPVFLVAGEAVWRKVSGGGFALAVERDEGALTGYRIAGVGEGSFSLVMLSVMEAVAQAERAEGIAVEELVSVWDDALARIAGPIVGSIAG